MEPELKPFLTALIIFLVLVGIYAILIGNPAPLIIQDTSNQPLGEIYGSTIAGQSFIATDNKLTRIDVMLATYARENTEDVIFKLSEIDSAEQIVNITVDAEKIQDNTYHSFQFDPIPQSNGKAYIFTISSPESLPGNAITIWYNTTNAYNNGTAIVNENSLEGDVRFVTYHTYSLSHFPISFLKKCMMDGLFFVFYVVLIGIIALLLIFHIVVNMRKKS